ncbi:MAG: cytochrome b [Burkholderiaceae bacterium]
MNIDTRPSPNPDADARYGRVAIALHWLIGLALLGQITFGFLLDDIAPRNTPPRAFVINLHKSFGIVLGLLIVARLVWRLTHRPPDWPAALPHWERQAARLGHWALYACMIVMPVSGYVGSNFSKYGVKFFGIAFAPWGSESPALYAFFNGTHVATAWIFTALIVGHIGVALKHSLVDRNGVFSRMWPGAPARETQRRPARASRRSRQVP